jgi:uncharacterized membrane protein YfcA
MEIFYFPPIMKKWIFSLFVVIAAITFFYDFKKEEKKEKYKYNPSINSIISEKLKKYSKIKTKPKVAIIGGGIGIISSLKISWNFHCNVSPRFLPK